MTRWKEGGSPVGREAREVNAGRATEAMVVVDARRVAACVATALEREVSAAAAIV
jgi:hypothetical protein